MSTLNISRRLAVLVSLVLLPMLFMAGCDEFGSDEPIETHDDSFQINGSLTVDVESFNGAITVTGSDTNVIRVQATLKRADKIDYSATRAGNRIQVSAVENSKSSGRSPSADLQISAPSTAVLILRTSNGSIEATNFEAGAIIKTSNARVTVDDFAGNLEAISSNGSIRVTDFTGSAELETSNGSITFNGTLVPGSDNGMKTSNGSVTVDVPDNLGLEFDGATSNGSVKSELPMTVSRSGDSYLEGTIGAGGTELTARTSNGSITVR